MPDAMSMMEHPEDTISALPLVDGRVLLRFCQAVQSYADSVGSHDEAARKLRDLQAGLDNLCGLATLCRFAIAGHPRAFGRVIDELDCLAADFPSSPLDESLGDVEVNEDEPDSGVHLAAALDLFAGAAFVSKAQPEQHERFIIGIVRAIEDAIAFPVAYSAEAAAYLGEDNELSATYVKIVIANATQRLIEGDRRCTPKVPADIRRRLEGLAIRWLHANPVAEFFDAVSGPKLHRIVFWQDPERERPDDARVGDRVTLFVHERGHRGDGEQDAVYGDNLSNLAVMFCPHQPAKVVRVLEDGFQVRVPKFARTGPIAIVRKKPDFTDARKRVIEYAEQYPFEWSSSVFANIRMDQWAYPCAFGPPIIEITKESPPAKVPATALDDFLEMAVPDQQFAGITTEGESVQAVEPQ
jgi:hypothetical protein